MLRGPRSQHCLHAVQSRKKTDFTKRSTLGLLSSLPCTGTGEALGGFYLLFRKLMLTIRLLSSFGSSGTAHKSR